MALTGAQLGTVAAKDISLAGYLYEVTSRLLLLPRSRFHLVFNAGIVDYDCQICKALKFYRETTLEVVLLEPSCFQECHPLELAQRPFSFQPGCGPSSYLACRNEGVPMPADCYCESVAMEFGWKGFRFWQYLVEQAMKGLARQGVAGV